MRPRTALVMIGDGRERYHTPSTISALRHLPSVDHVVVIDDAEHKLGFGGAIREAWQRVLVDTDADYVFHLELDFTFNRRIPLGQMIRVLQQWPHLVQMSLLRQPWNDDERAAGGIANFLTDHLVARSWGRMHWLEHRRHFTTNPSVYPRWVVQRGWPDCDASEGVFGSQLFEAWPEKRSAYWGRGEEWCTHIGNDREGTGY